MTHTELLALACRPEVTRLTDDLVRIYAQGYRWGLVDRRGPAPRAPWVSIQEGRNDR